jgi:hypothetical protein
MMTIPPQPPLEPMRGRSSLPSRWRMIGRALGSLLAALVGASIVLGAAWLMSSGVH